MNRLGPQERPSMMTTPVRRKKRIGRKVPSLDTRYMATGKAANWLHLRRRTIFGTMIVVVEIPLKAF